MGQKQDKNNHQEKNMQKYPYKNEQRDWMLLRIDNTHKNERKRNSSMTETMTTRCLRR